MQEKGYTGSNDHFSLLLQSFTRFPHFFLLPALAIMLMPSLPQQPFSRLLPLSHTFCVASSCCYSHSRPSKTRQIRQNKTSSAIDPASLHCCTLLSQGEYNDCNGKGCYVTQFPCPSSSVTMHGVPVFWASKKEGEERTGTRK